jgi:hypothetical protein
VENMLAHLYMQSNPRHFTQIPVKCDEYVACHLRGLRGFEQSLTQSKVLYVPCAGAVSVIILNIARDYPTVRLRDDLVSFLQPLHPKYSEPEILQKATMQQ